ncbi:USP domain-containing protein [Mycena sanguinolenta]|uniref:ubiquitinyl hydrolase 1 n=1 Tax=Mycena sanguinolenta TaxID=230812 RepID=A0A8H6Y3B8_9AGAR|nr:USP domain-containing protein [Mycena sanguinolenta]
MPSTRASAAAVVLQQILPLLIVVVVPLFALRLVAFARHRVMPLLPWKWGSAHSHGGEKEESGNGKGSNEKRRVRTRAEQVAEAQSKKEREKEKSMRVDDADAHFPGLVNMSGTHCFMNSTLQALASLSTLAPYLLAIRTRAEALDVPTPVVDALIDLLAALNTPASSPAQPLRALALVEALCAPPPSLDLSSSSSSSSSASPSTSSLATAFWSAVISNAPTNLGASAKATALLASHEHQDAQELFQLLSECVREEGARVIREGGRDRGLGFASILSTARGAVSNEGEDEVEAGMGTSPFDGLTATRRACVRCGYTAAIRHFAFDSVQLALEGAGGGWGGTTLPALLRAYTTLEVLQDCPCRRCALRATARRLQEEIARLEAPSANGHENGMIVTASPSALTANGHAPVANGHVHPDADEEEEQETKSPRKKGKSKHRKHKSKDEEKNAAASTSPNAKDDAAPTSGSRLRRLKTARKMEARLRRALEAGRIEEEDLEGDWDGEGKGSALAGLRIERVAGGVCTRQSMLGRPPAVLALHLNRSVHTGMRVAKNGARVAFPEILDLAPYTTSGVLNLDPTAALSGSLDPNGIAFPAAASRSNATEECLYRLAAVVVPLRRAFLRALYLLPPGTCAASSLNILSIINTIIVVDASVRPRAADARGERGDGDGMAPHLGRACRPCGRGDGARGGERGVHALLRAHPPAPPPPPGLKVEEEEVYAGDSAETIRPVHVDGGVGRTMSLSASSSASGVGTGIGIGGLWGAGVEGGIRPRVVRSVSLGLGQSSSRASPSLSAYASSSSSLSLQSISSVSSDSEGPATPRARAVDEDGAAAADVSVVEPLALADEPVPNADAAMDKAAVAPTPRTPDVSLNGKPKKKNPRKRRGRRTFCGPSALAEL